MTDWFNEGHREAIEEEQRNCPHPQDQIKEVSRVWQDNFHGWCYRDKCQLCGFVFIT